jgi:hypothetical protein
MNPLPCPFCGASAVGRTDGTEARPFVMRCSRDGCPGQTSQGFADAEFALIQWNRRVQLPPPNPEPVCDVFGFTKKSLMRGELISLTLDKTGVLTSVEIDFGWHKPLVRKPEV